MAGFRNWQEQPDGTILYRPSAKHPTYILTRQQYSQVRASIALQVVLGTAVALPVLLTTISWLSGSVNWLFVWLAAIAFGVVVPWGTYLDRQIKSILKGARVSETTVPFPTVGKFHASLWAESPAIVRWTLIVIPFVALFGSCLSLAHHLGGGFLSDTPELSLPEAGLVFLVSLVVCIWIYRTRRKRGG